MCAVARCTTVGSSRLGFLVSTSQSHSAITRVVTRPSSRRRNVVGRCKSDVSWNDTWRCRLPTECPGPIITSLRLKFSRPLQLQLPKSITSHADQTSSTGSEPCLRLTASASSRPVVTYRSSMPGDRSCCRLTATSPVSPTGPVHYWINANSTSSAGTGSSRELFLRE